MSTSSTKYSITLIRHGPPAVSLRQRVRGHQFRQFVERYDAAEIAQRSLPPRAVQQVVAQASVVFASHRPRATHTAKLLGAITPPTIHSQFREIEFPVDFPQQFKFSAFTWSVIALVLWRMGYSRQSESLAHTRARVRAATDLLERQIEEHLRKKRPSEKTSQAEISAKISVVLVAHGGINRLIAKELRKRGWSGPRMPRSQHWGCTTYCR